MSHTPQATGKKAPTAQAGGSSHPTFGTRGIQKWLVPLFSHRFIVNAGHSHVTELS